MLTTYLNALENLTLEKNFKADAAVSKKTKLGFFVKTGNLFFMFSIIF